MYTLRKVTRHFAPPVMKPANDIAAAEKLTDYVVTFVGSSGGGQYSFQMLCGHCNRQDTVSSSRRNINIEGVSPGYW